MKVRFNRWYNAVLTVLLSLMGYSCSSDDIVDEYGVPIAEVAYGCPYADYVVKGQVTDEAGNPIPGIQVTAPNGSDTDSEYSQIVKTDAQGGFTLREFSTSRGHEMIVEDIDGEDNNGLFESESMYVETLPMKQVKDGNGGWYLGKYEVTANIKLKKKE